MSNLVAARIRQARAAKNLTQQALAELTEVNVGSVKNWESNSMPRDAMLERIASALDVSSAYLRGEEDTPINEDINRLLTRAKIMMASALNIPAENIRLQMSFLA